MTCLGVLERGERGDDNETSLKEGGGIEMSTTVLSIYAMLALFVLNYVPNCCTAYVKADSGNKTNFDSGSCNLFFKISSNLVCPAALSSISLTSSKSNATAPALLFKLDFLLSLMLFQKFKIDERIEQM